MREEFGLVAQTQPYLHYIELQRSKQTVRILGQVRAIFLGGYKHSGASTLGFSRKGPQFFTGIAMMVGESPRQYEASAFIPQRVEECQRIGETAKRRHT